MVIHYGKIGLLVSKVDKKHMFVFAESHTGIINSRLNRVLVNQL